MWYPIKNNELIVIVLLTLLVVANVAYDWFRGDQGTVGVLIAVGMLFLLGLTVNKTIVTGMRTDEHGIVLERRLGLKHLFYPWEQVTVSYRKKEGRAAEGVLLELHGVEEGEERPYFIPLRKMEDKDQLLAELRDKLGVHYQEEVEG